MHVVNLEGMQSSLAVMHVYGVGKVCGTPCRRGLVSVVFHSSGREACFVQPLFSASGVLALTLRIHRKCSRSFMMRWHAHVNIRYG